MSDKSNLERKLAKLMNEYKQPLTAESRPNYGLVTGLSALATVAVTGVLAIGLYFGSQFFRSAPALPLPSPTPVVEFVAEVSPIPSPEVITVEIPVYVSQPTPTTPPPTNTPIPSPTFNHTSLPAPQVVMEGPFRQHYTAAIGSGPLMNVTYSDGMATFDEEWLATYHYRLQRIRPEENPDGCGVSIYNTDKIWFGCAMPTTITVNDSPIAELYVPTGSHGYILNYPLNIGDKICVTKFNRSGYHIYFGPDMYWHYDSYCYRGHCRS